jgi:ribosome biogenesis GTPase
MIDQVKHRVKDVPIFPISSMEDRYKNLEAVIEPEKTYCLLGSSGVGKSTLLNSLSGKERMATGAISTSVNKGRHVTSHRELIVLDNGGILIDNPGMREVGIADTASGLETTFDLIMEYGQQCKYSDCTHMHEKGCAIIEAVENGDIDEDAYTNFQKMMKEKRHFEADALEKRKKDKMFGKLIKNIQKERRKNKY